MLTLIAFSPTHTGYNVAQAILQGLGNTPQQLQHIDLCRPTTRAALPSIQGDGVIIVAPCYEAHLPPVVRRTLAMFNGHNLPAIAIIMYGNRVIGVALKEMVGILTDAHLRVVGTGSFVGEHSYAGEKLPIALDRPDEEDLATARQFGNELRQLDWTALNSDGFTAGEIKGSINVMFRLLPEGFFGDFVRPAAIDPAKCIKCGKCARDCPMVAISTTVPHYPIDRTKCIHCMACVKFCPQHARPMHYRGLGLIRRFMAPALITRKKSRYVIVKIGKSLSSG